MEFRSNLMNTMEAGAFMLYTVVRLGKRWIVLVGQELVDVQ
jgi:hypothetical protein